MTGVAVNAAWSGYVNAAREGRPACAATQGTGPRRAATEVCALSDESFHDEAGLGRSRAPGQEEDFALLLDAVREGGRIALSHFRRPVGRSVKPDGTDVSEADLAVDRFLKEALGAARPGYGWLSEESEDDPARLAAERVWIVDPIDGTYAFLKGASEWTVCAALAERGVVTLGAVYNPASGELFTARAGQGAALNGQPVRVRDADRLEGARLAVSTRLFHKNLWDDPWPPMDLFWVYSIAYRLSLVAAGRAEGSASLTLMSEWDVAAASLVVQEAGGVVTQATGEPLTFNKPAPRVTGVIAAGPGLHRLLGRRIAPAAAQEKRRRERRS